MPTGKKNEKWCRKCKYELITESEVNRAVNICDECWHKIPLDKRREILSYCD